MIWYRHKTKNVAFYFFFIFVSFHDNGHFESTNAKKSTNEHSSVNLLIGGVLRSRQGYFTYIETAPTIHEVTENCVFAVRSDQCTCRILHLP